MTTRIDFEGRSSVTISGTREHPAILPLSISGEHIRSAIIDFGDGALFTHSQQGRNSNGIKYSAVVLDENRPTLDFTQLDPYAFYIDSSPKSATWSGLGETQTQ